jgi:hypothetical protein
MKKAIFLIVTLLLGVTPSYADVYVKVDSEGNAIGGAIACTAEVCGNSNSGYSKATLNEGERYVLQGYGQAGIGNNNSDTQIKVDIPTQTWTITTPQDVSTFTPTQPTPISLNPKPVIVDTSTAIFDSSTVLSDTRTVMASLNSIDTVEKAIAYIQLLIQELFAIIQRLGIKG